MTDGTPGDQAPKLCSAHEFGPDLLRYFGLQSKNCRRAKILLEPSDVVTVVAEYYATTNGKITNNTRMKHYKLTPSLREKPYPRRQAITIKLDSNPADDFIEGLHAKLGALLFGGNYYEARQLLKWKKHPVYQWAQRKIGAA